jgi:hypothetical protein
MLAPMSWTRWARAASVAPAKRSGIVHASTGSAVKTKRTWCSARVVDDEQVEPGLGRDAVRAVGSVDLVCLGNAEARDVLVLAVDGVGRVSLGRGDEEGSCQRQAFDVFLEMVAEAVDEGTFRARIRVGVELPDAPPRHTPR